MKENDLLDFFSLLRWAKLQLTLRDNHIHEVQKCCKFVCITLKAGSQNPYPPTSTTDIIAPLPQ